MDVSAEDVSCILPAPLTKSEPPGETGRTLTEFALFPKLIVELRLKIWEYCFSLQEPRLVEVQTQPHDCDQHSGWCPRFSACRLPTLVHVSPEARMVAYEVAHRAGHLCFGTKSSPANVFFNPDIDRLYLPVEKAPWRRDTGETDRRRHRARDRLRRLAPVPFHPAIPAANDTGLAAVSLTTSSQFKKCHRPDSVRFLVADFDIQRPSMSHDSVRIVIENFPRLQELIFVVPEHVHTYEDMIRNLGLAADSIGSEREIWANAFESGAVSWEWPTVRLAFRCKGELKFTELEGRHD